MISWELTILVAATCVLVEGFFSGAEIAVVSANRALLRHAAAAGDRSAARVERLLERPQILLATTLVGTNVATVTFSVVVTLALIGHEIPHSEILAVAMVTPCTLLLGEVVPKTLFQRRADALVARIAYPLFVASILLRPVVWVMGAFAMAIARLLGVERDQAFITRGELLLLLEVEAESSPSLDGGDDEMAMISNVLHVTERPVEEIMVRLSEMVALPESATLAAAALEVSATQHTRIPIYRDRVDTIVGVLHAFDLLGQATDGGTSTVAELARPAVFVPEVKPAGELLAELQGAGNQLAVVVDEYGGATGIITVEDILEEIVGEIDDEHDGSPRGIVRENEDTWRVSGRTSVHRINDELGLELPEDQDYESIAGVFLARLKRIPRTGESLAIGAETMTVVRASPRTIDIVRIHVGRSSRARTRPPSGRLRRR